MTTYTARSLPNLKGPAAWNTILGDQPPCIPLAGQATADVVVIGAGFAGLSAARRLNQLDPGLRIMVLDALRIAEGTAGRNSGFMIDLPHDLASEDYASATTGPRDERAKIALNRKAIAFAGDAVEDYGIDPNYFDRSGKVNGAASPSATAQNESYARHLAALGEPCETLDAAAMRALTGSAHYVSGLYTAGTVILQPAGYIRGLAAGLTARGVTIHENTPALSFSKTGSDWQITTPDGHVNAPKLILTVNGHLESFGIERGRLMQLFLYGVMTPELDADALAKIGGRPRWGVTPSDPMGTTVRRIDTPLGGNRIVTRTAATLRPDMKVSAGDISRAARLMQQKFEARFPALKGLKMEHTWAGHLCLSLNGVAVAREIDQGVYSGCVQNGLGTARGTLTGIAAAETAMGVSSDITRHFATESRPKRLPPSAFHAIGGNAVLRWKQWRAGSE